VCKYYYWSPYNKRDTGTLIKNKFIVLTSGIILSILIFILVSKVGCGGRGCLAYVPPSADMHISTLTTLWAAVITTSKTLNYFLQIWDSPSVGYEITVFCGVTPCSVVDIYFIVSGLWSCTTLGFFSKWDQPEILLPDLRLRHCTSLKVAVQGPDFMSHSLYIHTYV
jgi:hypothetical protein